MRALPILIFTLVVSVASALNADVRRVRYSVELLQRNAGGVGVPVHALTLTGLIDVGAGGRDVVYRIDEAGAPSLDWYERVGRYGADADGHAAGDLPVFRYRHGGRPYMVRVHGPVFEAPSQLAEDSSWQAEWDARAIRYSVRGDERTGNRDCWAINGASAVGRGQSLLIEKGTGLLVSANARVFLGMGDRFDLIVSLTGESTLTGEEARAAMSAASAILDLKASLRTNRGENAAPFTAAELKQVEEAVPAIALAAEGTDWKEFVDAMGNSVTTARDRARSVEDLAAKAVGKPAPQVSLPGLDDTVITVPAQQGRVLVLHFWEYRGEPESPFGQVGYLDFLARKRSDEVLVYGVAVDERAGESGTRRELARDVRKFSSQFMRLEYPILLDDGALLKKFGDPRSLEMPLPLWVAIAPDGKIAHFHTGLYSIDPNRGLEQIDALVDELAKTEP